MDYFTRTDANDYITKSDSTNYYNINEILSRTSNFITLENANQKINFNRISNTINNMTSEDGIKVTSKLINAAGSEGNIEIEGEEGIDLNSICITMPNQPRFFANRGENGAPAKGESISYNLIQYNNGNYFDGKVFTVPFNGWYLFTGTITFYAMIGFAELALLINDKPYTIFKGSIDNMHSNKWVHTNYSMQKQLQKGDKVSVIVVDHSNLQINGGLHANSFAGILLA